jgi:pilus assembly protein CpaC
MNIATREAKTQRSQKQTIGKKLASGKMRLAAWSVLAGLALSATSLGADAPATQEITAAQPTTQPTSRATGSLVSNGLSPSGNISLMVNKSQVITTRVPYKRVSIAQPDIADVTLVGANEVLVTAKKAGATQLILWDDGDHSQIIDVVVTFDLRALQEQIKALFPTSNIDATSANGTIVLRGRVPDLSTAQQAVQVATPYGTSVLNFMEVSGGRQVMLQVRFAEVSRSATTQLGFNAFSTDGIAKLGFNNGPGPTPVGGLATGAASTQLPPVSLFGAGKIGDTSFEFFIDALRQNNLLRTLAEPNLITMSGKEATFLAGGEYPVPVPQTQGGGGTAITVDYKQFGVRLRFTPTVLGNGRIRLLCNPAVSDLDYTNSVSFNGFVIPSITERTVTTQVELNEGQTFALAGLLNNRVTANKSVTPLLGDIPVLGALFRSVKYIRNETELVVLVTPRVVSAMDPNQVPRLPGELWRHPSEAELLLGKDLGGPAADMAHSPSSAPAVFHGRYGFNPATTQSDK